jgi:mono/diheme cytochrome c family protein
MSTLVFVLVWVVLGLGLLFIAISGGPGGARTRLQSQSRGSRRASVVLFLLALIVLGAGIPAAVIASVDHRSSIPEADVYNLTSAEKHGQQLFGERCAACHTLKASNAIAEIGPNLDELRPNKALVLATIHSGKAAGNGQMAADLYVGQDAQDVAAYVAKAVGTSGSGSQ